ncbi:MAG: OmpA family protein [Chitinophagales bacterium]
MIKKYFLFATLLISLNAMYSQAVTTETASKKAVKFYKEGVEAVLQSDYKTALLFFEKALAEEPNFVEALKNAGNANFELREDSTAVEYYKKAINLNPDTDIGIYRRLAEAEQALMRYAEGYEHINIFLENPKIVGVTRKNAEHLKASLQFAMEAIKSPVDFNPVNLGSEVNSEFSEYFPSLSADNSVMVITRKIPVPGVSENADEIDRLQEDFFISKRDSAKWGKAKNVGKPVNTMLNEGAQSISADGKNLVYTLCNHPLGFGSCDLYFSVSYNETWSEPANCGKKINSGDWDSQPSISADGKFLYFSSSRSGGMGGIDIWVSERNDKGYLEKPVNLGPTINTPFDDQSPFIHQDGKTLYFSSDGHPNFGGKDLFYAKLDAENRWLQPVNLGFPINSSKDEITLTVSSDGSTAYYASDKASGFGGLDIYQFDLPSALRPDPVTYVKATVRDEKSKIPLKSNVQLIDIANGDTLLNYVTDPRSGEFLVCLPVGKRYALYVNKEGYLFHSENFSLENAIPDAPYLIDIYLQPIKLGEVVTLKNIFFETGSSELLPESKTEILKIKELLTKNPALKIQLNGHTDDVGSEPDNLKLSQSRALSVKDFLVQQGIDGVRLTTAGFGESKPLANNQTEDGRAMNRRTEMEITGI